MNTKNYITNYINSIKLNYDTSFLIGHLINVVLVFDGGRDACLLGGLYNYGYDNIVKKFCNNLSLNITEIGGNTFFVSKVKYKLSDVDTSKKIGKILGMQYLEDDYDDVNIERVIYSVCMTKKGNDIEEVKQKYEKVTHIFSDRFFDIIPIYAEVTVLKSQYSQENHKRNFYAITKIWEKIIKKYSLDYELFTIIRYDPGLNIYFEKINKGDIKFIRDNLNYYIGTYRNYLEDSVPKRKIKLYDIDLSYTYPWLYTKNELTINEKEEYKTFSELIERVMYKMIVEEYWNYNWFQRVYHKLVDEKINLPMVGVKLH